MQQTAKLNQLVLSPFLYSSSVIAFASGALSKRMLLIMLTRLELTAIASLEQTSIVAGSL